MTTGTLIRQVRIAASLRLEDIGAVCKKSAVAVLRWETGVNRCPDHQLAAIARACHVPLATLTTHRLTPAAFKVCKAYRGLSAADKAAVRKQLEMT